jgi:hypothetical protein
MRIPVFRNGSWISYTVPSDVENLWSKSLQLQAASVYATAISKGLEPSQSAILAEIYVNKQLYADIQYPSQLEDRLKSLYV